MKNLLKFDSKTNIAGLLLVLALVGAAQHRWSNVITQLIFAVTVAVGADLIINYLKMKKLFFPSSAFITGMIIALVLAPQTSWYIVSFASIIAIIQKHILRFKNKHIFNPANFGLLATMFIFSIYPNWWAQGPWTWALFIVAGGFICYKTKRLIIPIVFVLTFLITFGLNNIFGGQPFKDSFILINLFFVFVMLIEPKTSPIIKKEQYVYAVIAALFSFIYFKSLPQYDFSILSLASANLSMFLINKIFK